MNSFVDRLSRPYDTRVLIEAYVYTQRTDFVHADFGEYYAGLLVALEGLFGLRLSDEGLSVRQKMVWGLFRKTVRSLLQIPSPWDGYLEAGLMVKTLEQSGAWRVVDQASAVIRESNQTSERAHRDMLHALFTAIFGEGDRVVTSGELRQAGFDDTREPDMDNYWDYV